MAKRVSTHRIRKNRLYTYEDAGNCLGITSRTIRAWRAQGLSVLTGNRPHYVLGEAIIEFVECKQVKRCVKLGLDQMYCFKCKAPKNPLGAMVDYIAINTTKGRFVGLCEACEGPLHRFVGKADLPRFADIYDIAVTRSP